MARAEAKYNIRATDKTRQATQSAKKNFGGLDKAVKNVAATLAASFAARAVVQGIKSTATSLDDLAKRSKQLGMSSSELDAWNHAAELSGAGAEGLSAGMRRLPGAMYDATRGLLEQVDAFKALGVSVTDDTGQLKDLTTMLLDMAGGMEKIPSATMRAGIAQKLLGRSAQAMIPLLAQGKDALREQLIEAHALGTRFDRTTAKGEDFIDAEIRLNRALRNTKDMIVSEVLPGLSMLAEEISENVMGAITGLDNEFRRFIGELRIMPTQTALDQIVVKEQMIREELEKINAEHGKAIESWKRTSDIASETAGGGAIIDLAISLLTTSKAAREAYDRIGELNRQLAALGDEEENIQRRIELLNMRQAEWNALTEEANRGLAEQATAEERLAALKKTRADSERYIASVIDKITPKQDKLNKEILKASVYLRFGALSLDQYTAYVRLLKEELADAPDAVDEIGESAVSLRDEMREAAQGMEYAFTRAIFNINEGLQSILNLLAQIAEQAAAVLVGRYITGPLINSIFPPVAVAGAGGGIVDPGFMGPPTNQMASDGFTPVGGDTINMNVNITALDTQSGAQVVAQNMPMIVGALQNEFTKRGKKGPLG